jgi:hypothetical protein
MVAAAALFVGGATLAIVQTSPPDKSKSKAGAPWQDRTRKYPNLVRAKAQAQAERLCRPLTLRQNPTGKTQKKQKSEANDPQQGGKKQ